VTLTRTIQAQIASRDIFGDPVGYTPTTSQVTILVSEQNLQEMEIEAGGKPKESLMFMTPPGTIMENDEITYTNGHVYKVQSVTQVPLGGTNAVEVCEAWREVAP